MGDDLVRTSIILKRELSERFKAEGVLDKRPWTTEMVVLAEAELNRREVVREKAKERA